MSSSRFAERVEFDIRPSRLLGGALIVLHAGAVALVAAVTLPFWAQLLLGAAVLTSLWQSIGRHVRLLHPNAITGLICDGAAQWWVRFRSGDTEPVTILPTSYLHSQLVVLNLRSTISGQVRSAILLGDNIDRTTFRRLRVRLLLAKADFRDARLARSSKAGAS